MPGPEDNPADDVQPTKEEWEEYERRQQNKEAAMFHVSGNLFFGRLPDGRVRILKFAVTPAEFPRTEGVYPDAVLDQTIDDGHWGSVVASVSAKGEAGGRWYQAMDFHHGRG